MKKYLAALTVFLLLGCAKNHPEFIPISLNWFEFQMEENAESAAATDSSQEELCLVAMTRSLMENATIRENAKAESEYDVQYFGTRKADETIFEFRGKCKDPRDTLDLEREALQFSDAKNCNFTARCDAKGKVRDLRVF